MHVCQWSAPAGNLAGVCEHCGHAVMAHVGTPHCAVCYMLAVAEAMKTATRDLGLQLRRMADSVRDQSWPNT